MTDFRSNVWNDERIYMVDFGRSPSRSNPQRSRPDIDRYGYHDDANAAEHGPIVTCRTGQGRVRVRFYRTEVSKSARLYAVAANGNSTVRILSPRKELPSRRASTITFRPVASGRTSIDIRYHWPDGPIIGRLYVDVRRTRTINVRTHLVTYTGGGFGNTFLDEARPAGTTGNQHRTDRIAALMRDANHVLQPHGIRLRNRETVNTAWTAANFGPVNTAAGNARRTSRRAMQAMATSPNRSAARLNLYLLDFTTVPPNLTFVALGPPVNWARAVGSSFPNAAGGANNIGSGIIADTNASPFTGSILAHEFAHVFRLCSLTAAGGVNQWHSIGDTTASRDDYLTRRRLMYPYTGLRDSNNAWRNDVGYGDNMGALLTVRQMSQDMTHRESRRAYNNATPARVYAP